MFWSEKVFPQGSFCEIWNIHDMASVYFETHLLVHSYWHLNSMEYSSK